MAVRVDAEDPDLAVTPAPKRRKTAHQAIEGTDDFCTSLLSYHLEGSADGGGVVGNSSSISYLVMVLYTRQYAALFCRTG